MQNEISCCSNLSAMVPTTSPFSRFIILDAVPDDVSGVAECGACQTAYSFDTIQYGNPRDEHGSRRYTLIHSMRRLPTGSFERMAELVALTRKPPPKRAKFAAWLFQRLDAQYANFYSHWPVWEIDWNQPEHIRTNLLNALRTIIDSAPPPEFIVASDDLTTEIIAAQTVSPADRDQVHDWFSFLGLDYTASVTT